MKLNVLIGCEESGVVREAFCKLGHNAWSCDLLPTRTPGNHYQCDVREAVKFQDWHLFIVHPDCTYMANSGALRLYVGGKKENGIDIDRWQKMVDAAKFFKEMLYVDIPFVAAENPIMLGYAKYIIGVEQTQVIQPWQFGDDASKATCLWLRNLPNLIPTNVLIKDRYSNQTPSGQNKLGPSVHRKRMRSQTYPGVSNAMAEQWGCYVESMMENKQ